MRTPVRMALAVTMTLAVALPLAGASRAMAAPDPNPGTPSVGGPSVGGPSMPSQSQVDKAKRDVARKTQSVASIEGELAAAQARMEAAAQAAEIAFEKYNGARWELQQAKAETRRAKAASSKAAADVATERTGIAQLVTESYQNGTALNTATALMSDEGPQGLMNRYGVVQSAGDSMQAAYDRYTTASKKAKSYAGKAAKAEEHQQSLAAQAKQLATAAGQAAADAGAVTNQIAAQKSELVQALAKAQDISVDLARKRTDALEKIAQQKKAEEAQAKAEALAKAHAEAVEAAAKAKQSKKNQPQGAPGSDGSDSTDSLPPISSTPALVINPAPNQTIAVERTIAYAKAQLGKPYRWAAAGPSSFDCSGLTMQAWARGGKALPHYSVAQYAQSTPISMLDAKAGDLLFWSSNGSPSGIHHVALYLGGGQFIEAPHTGADVRYNSIFDEYPDFVARP